MYKHKVMIEFISLVIFIICVGGIAIIVARKIPVLIKLPQNGDIGFRSHKFVLALEQELKKVYYLFEKQIILHKILSYAKVLVLKIETQIDKLLHGIRKKAKENKEKEKKN